MAKLNPSQSLIRAVESGNLSEVKRCLVSSGNVNEAGKYQPTPLIRALELGNQALAGLLLQAGADPNLKCRGQTPLGVAIKSRLVAAVEALLASGANPNQVSFDLNAPPLFYAVSHGDSWLITQLLKAGANTDDQKSAFGTFDSDLPGLGRTSLMQAADVGNLGIAKQLLEAGGDPWIKGIENKTAYELVAKRANRKEVATLLLDWMQKHPAKPAEPAAAPASDCATPFASWADAVSRLESLTASKSAPHPRAKAIVRFMLSPETARTLAGPKAAATAGRKLTEVYRAALASVQSVSGDLKVCWFLQFEPRQSAFLCALPKGDPWKVLVGLKPACANFGVTHSALLKFLKSLDADHPFTLVDCDEQSVGGHFTGKLNTPSAVAKRIHAFCPFTADDHSGDIKRFAKAIAATGHFKLWWD